MDPFTDVHLRYVFLEHAASTLPWIIGGGILLVGSYLSPLGRGLMRHLRESRRDMALSEAMLGELSELRITLAEVVERLDSTEQELTRVRTFASRSADVMALPLVPPSEPRIPTPH